MMGTYYLSPALPHTPFILVCQQYCTDWRNLFIPGQRRWCIHLTACIKHASSGRPFPIALFTCSQRSVLLPKSTVISSPPPGFSFRTSPAIFVNSYCQPTHPHLFLTGGFSWWERWRTVSLHLLGLLRAATSMSKQKRCEHLAEDFGKKLQSSGTKGIKKKRRET